MFTSRISRFFAVLLLIAVFLGTASFATHSAILPKADRSYDALEQARDLRHMAVLNSSSYEQIEALRIQRNSLAANAGYDAIEQLRNGRGIIADRSYDTIETLRLQP